MSSPSLIETRIVANAFDPQNFITDHLEYQEGKTLADYLFDIPEDQTWLVSINQVPVAEEDWSLHDLTSDDVLTMVLVPEGGEGGAKQVLRFVALIALTVVTGGIASAGWFIGAQLAGTMIAYAVAGAVSIAGTMLINALLPPPTMDLGNAGNTPAADSPSYGFEGSKPTARNGVVIPVVAGEYTVAGNITDIYTENDNDDQFLFIRTVINDGKISELVQVYLNDQPIENFKDYEVALWNAEGNDDVDWFDKSRRMFQVGSEINTGEYLYYTTQDEITQARFDMLAPRGLVRFDDQGDKHPVTVTFQIQYREVGSGASWQALQCYAEESVQYVQQGNTAAFNNPNGGLFFRVAARVYDESGADANYVEVRHRNDEGVATEWQPVINETPEVYEVQSPNGGYFRTHPTQRNVTREQLGFPAGGTIEARSPNHDIDTIRYQYPTYSNLSMTGKKTSTVRRSYVTTELPKGRYEFRMKRVSPSVDENDEDADRTADVVVWSEIAEIQGEKVDLIGTTAVGLKIRATDQLSRQPKLTARIKGRPFKIYDRNGNVIEEKWTANAASYALDILTDPYGANYSHDRIDWPAWRELYLHCEENGLNFNGVVDFSTNVWDILQIVLRVARAQIVPFGTKWSVTIDRKEDPTGFFSDANIIENTMQVNYMFTGDRADEIRLTWYDKDDHNRAKVLRSVAPNVRVNGRTPKVASYSGIGIDNIDQANYEVALAHRKNALVRKTISFEAPLEAIAITQGAVAEVQHAFAEYKTGVGGIAQSGSTSDTIVLDRPIPFEAGEQYRLLLHYPALKRYDVNVVSIDTDDATAVVTGVSSSPETVTRLKGADYDVRVVNLVDIGGGQFEAQLETITGVSTGSAELWQTNAIIEYELEDFADGAETVQSKTPFDEIPHYGQKWVIGKVGFVTERYRLTEISGSDLYRKKLSFVHYPDELHDPIDAPLPLIGNSQSYIVEPVSQLAASIDTEVVGDGAYFPVEITWSGIGVTNYGGADIYLDRDGLGFKFHASVQNVNSYEFMGKAGNVVAMKVVSFDTSGKRSSSADAPIYAVEVTDKPLPIPAPSSAVITHKAFDTSARLEVSFTPPTITGKIEYRVTYKPLTDAEFDDLINEVVPATYSETNANYQTWRDGFTTSVVTTESPAVITSVPKGKYQICIRAERGQSKSEWVSLLYDISAPAFVANVTGLSVEGVTPGQFEGRDARITWDDIETLIANSPLVTDKDEAVFRFKDFLISVIDDQDNLIRTETRPDARFVYTYEMNVEDSESLSVKARRSFKVSVQARGKQGQLSSATTLQISNPAPDALTGISNTPVIGGNTVDLPLSDDTDFRGYRVWVKPTNDIVAADPSYTTSQQSFTVPLNGETKYIRVAAFDAFSDIPADLNLSTPVEISDRKIVAGDVDFDEVLQGHINDVQDAVNALTETYGETAAAAQSAQLASDKADEALQSAGASAGHAGAAETHSQNANEAKGLAEAAKQGADEAKQQTEAIRDDLEASDKFFEIFRITADTVDEWVITNSSTQTLVAENGALKFGYSGNVVNQNDPASGNTGATHFELPADIERASWGSTIKLVLDIEAPATNASSNFALAYSSNEIGNTNWQVHATPGSRSEVEIQATWGPDTTLEGDFIGVVADSDGLGGELLVHSIRVLKLGSYLDAVGGAAVAAAAAASKTVVAGVHASEAGVQAGAANQSRIDAQAAAGAASDLRDETEQLKNDTNTLKGDTAQLKADAALIKNDAVQAKVDAEAAEGRIGTIEQAVTEAQGVVSGLAQTASEAAETATSKAGEASTSAEASNSKSLEAASFRDQALQALQEQGRTNIIYRNGFATTEDVDSNSGWGVRVSNSAIATHNVSVELEQDEIASVRFKARLITGTGTETLRVDFLPDTLPETTFTVSETEQEFVWEGVTLSSANPVLFRLFNPSMTAGKEILVTDIKVELGETSTTWTPSLKDARNYAIASASYAQSASSDASDASEAAGITQGYKLEAETARNNAGDFAQDASDFAGAAFESSQTAASFAGDAETAAQATSADKAAVAIDRYLNARRLKAMAQMSIRWIEADGTAQIAAIEDDTQFFKNGVLAETLNAFETGTIECLAGDQLVADKPARISGFRSELAASVFADKKFIVYRTRNNPAPIYIMSPFTTAIVDIWEYDKSLDTGDRDPSGAPTVSVTVPAGTVYTHTTGSSNLIEVRLSASSDILVFNGPGTSSTDGEFCPPIATRIVNPRSVSNNYVPWNPSEVVTNHGHKTSESEGGHTVTAAGDGNGADMNVGLPLFMMGDNAITGHDIADYRLVMIEPGTVTARNSAGVQAVHTAPDGTTFENPYVVEIGDQSGGGTTIWTGVTHWSGTTEFFLRTNNLSGVEYTVLGWLSDMRSAFNAGDIVATRANVLASAGYASNASGYAGDAEQWAGAANESRAEAEVAFNGAKSTILKTVPGDTSLGAAFFTADRTIIPGSDFVGTEVPDDTDFGACLEFADTGNRELVPKGTQRLQDDHAYRITWTFKVTQNGSGGNTRADIGVTTFNGSNPTSDSNVQPGAGYSLHTVADGVVTESIVVGYKRSDTTGLDHNLSATASTFRPQFRQNRSELTDGKIRVAGFVIEDVTAELNAEIQAGLAGQAAGAAAGHSEDAEGYAGDAGSYAGAAASSFANAQAAYDGAKATLIKQIPGDFSLGEGYFVYNAFDGTPETINLAPEDHFVTGDADFGDCYEFPSASNVNVGTRDALKLTEDHAYRFTWRYKVISDGTTGFGVRMAFGGSWLNADYSAVTNNDQPVSDDYKYIADGVIERSIVVGYKRSDTTGLTSNKVSDCALYRPHIRQNAGSTTNGKVRVAELIIEDVTAELNAQIQAGNAAGSAGAAAGYSSDAEGYAGDAGLFASAANEAKVQAQAARDTASDLSDAALAASIEALPSLTSVRGVWTTNAVNPHVVAFEYENDSELGECVKVDNNNQFALRKNFPYRAGDVYRITATVKCIQNASNGGENGILLTSLSKVSETSGVGAYTSADGPIHLNNLTVADGAVTLVGEITVPTVANAKFFVPYMHTNWGSVRSDGYASPSDGGAHGNAVNIIQEFKIENITALKGAEAAASAASGSANDASGFAGDASESAGQASGFAQQAAQASDDAADFRDEAGGYASTASGSAGIAAGHAASASESAQTAQSWSEIAARRAVGTPFSWYGNIDPVADWVAQNGTVTAGTRLATLRATGGGASSGGTTQESYLAIPKEITKPLWGKRIRVRIYAKQSEIDPSTEFKAAYSTAAVGNSGYHVFTPTTSKQWFEFDYEIPASTDHNVANYLGICADTSGSNLGIDVYSIEIQEYGVGAQVEVNSGAIDTINNTSAFFNVLVAAAGSNPAIIQLLAGNGGSIARLAADIITLTNTGTGGTTVDALKAENGIVSILNKLILGASGQIELDPSVPALIFNAGSAKAVLGAGFGASSNLVLWFGPSMALSAMTKANASMWLDTSGSAYFGGSLSAGVLTNSAETSSLTVATSASTGAFGSNGNQISVTWSSTWLAETSGSYPVPFDPGDQAIVRLYRKKGTGAETLVATHTIDISTTITDMGGLGGVDWVATQQYSNSWTYTDPDLSTDDREYRVEIVQREESFAGYTSRSARQAVVCVEE